jgi:putative aldouronate transport system permease protein
MFGNIIAFQRFSIFKGYFGSPWVGLKWFQQFFTDPYFFRIVKNTFLLSFYGVIFGFPAPIIFALLLNEIRASGFKRFTQATSYLPHFISLVVIVGIMYKLFGFDGGVNQILALFNAGPVKFLGHPRWFRTMYIGSGIWQQMGWGAIIYLAAITGISQDHYDAAEVDGCGKFRKIRHVTLPGILPTIVILLILRLSRLLEVGFEKVFLMYQETTYQTADVIATYVYRRGIVGADYSYAAAVGLFEGVVGLTLIVMANRLAKAATEYSLW